MATLDKLAKALEALKLSKDSAVAMEDEAALRRKKKMELCSFVADTMCSPNVKTTPNFASLLSFSLETLLQLCNDGDTDIRMVADESLNRIIRSMMDNNIVKVHVELHKEIKKNGSVRSLRAALSRFAQLAHMIRPQKGKAYIQNLVPCLVEIAGRKEEAVLETLASSLPQILSALGPFTSDNNIQDLLKSFMSNLTNEETVVRRTAATSIVNVCLHSRKPQYFLTRTLRIVLDLLKTSRDKAEGGREAVLGTLNCVRQLLLYLDTSDSAQAPVDCLIEVYELCLIYASNEDHNLVTTALEALHQLLVNAPSSLVRALTSPAGLGASRLLTDRPGERSLTPSMERRSPDSPVASLDTQEHEDDISHARLVASTTPSVVDSASEESDAESSNRREFVPVTPLLVGSTMERSASLESEALLRDDSPSPSPLPAAAPCGEATGSQQVWNVGDPLERDIALKFCCRRLVTSFLLPDSESVRVRISVRALALQCITQVLRLNPKLFFCSIDLNHQSTKDGFSRVSDVLSHASHTDPQLRGLLCVLVGTLVRAVLTTHHTFQQYTQNCGDDTLLQTLVDLLIAGLKDESSVCVRHALSGLQVCLPILLKSSDHEAVLQLLPPLLQVASNPYWLVKVKLLEILGDLSFLHIYHVTNSCEFQNRTLNSVLLGTATLGDEDPRVRTAVCSAIASAVENCYWPIDEGKNGIVFSMTSRLTNSFLSGLFDRHLEPGTEVLKENSLSRIIHMLTSLLLQSSSKHLTSGCCEALSTLSEKYPPSNYPKAWHCFLAKPATDGKSSPSASGLLGLVTALLTSSPSALDLDIHYWLLTLAGNLFTGLASRHLKVKDFNESHPPWSQFTDHKLAELSEHLLLHLMRLLRTFVRVLDDSSSKNPTPSPIKRKPPRATSPAKQTINTGEKEINKEEKGNFGQFAHIPHYNKMYENLKSAYSSYKSQLECSDKLAKLLNATLSALGCLLEFAQQPESGRVAEEMLNYLRTTVSLEPTASVTTVQQLLKSLFGCNTVAMWDDKEPALPPPPLTHPSSPTTPPPCGLSEIILQQPFAHLGLRTDEPNDLTLLHNRLQREGMNQRKASSVIKGLMKTSDRQALASYIRLFEPMVIQALKQYTVTNNVRLQAAVLSLLTQLVQLRVNYCLLDSDQIFIEFVLKQFEFLELGQIKGAEVLIPKMFEFLGHLSYEKNHSKLVISVAKVIQLCDGLMASGQDPLTHCIPALLPIVEHVFMTASSTSAWQVKTQRDVVVAMLLRLAEYPQVLKLLTIILRIEKGSEECRRWALQTADVLMPLFTQGRVRLDSPQDLITLLCLLDSFPPRTFSPPDPVLRVLFASQRQEIECESRSYAGMLAMLVYLVGHTEDSVLARLEDLKLCVREQSDDPLNATAANINYPPHIELGRLLVRTLYNLAHRLHISMTSCYDDGLSSLLQYLLCHFIVCCTHLLRSSSHQTMASGFVKAAEMESYFFLDTATWICSDRVPLVAILWSNLVAVVSPDKSFWPRFIECRNNDEEQTSSLCAKVSRRGHLMAYCNFITEKPASVGDSAWLISQHLDLLLSQYTETAVSRYLEVCRCSALTSGLLLPAVAKVCAADPQPRLLSRILDFLVTISLDDSGSVLNILVPLLQHSHLVLARRAAALASSRVEYLLILETEEVTKLFYKEDLISMLKTLTSNNRLASKHSGLVGLLHKLGSTHYQLNPPTERNVNTHTVQSLELDKSWFLTQVRSRCCQPGSARQGCQLLSQLELDDISSVFRCQQFNNSILQHCFTLGAQLSIQERKDKENEKVEHLSVLFCAAQTALFTQIRHLHSLLPRLHQVYNPVGRPAFPKESKFTDRLNELFTDAQFLEALFRLIPPVTGYIQSVLDLSPSSQSLISSEAREDLAKFGILCVEVLHWFLNKGELIGEKRTALECAVNVLRLDSLCQLLTITHLGSVTAMLATFVHCLSGQQLTLPIKLDGVVVESRENNLSMSKLTEENSEEDEGLSVEEEEAVGWYTGSQVAALVSWLESSHERNTCLQQELASVRSLVRSVGRCRPLMGYSLAPPDTWHVSPSPLPSTPSLPCAQDIDTLRQLIYRISLFGWTSRTQFEETWVSLLTALSPGLGPDTAPDEAQTLVQMNSFAVQTITSLLAQTLLQPVTGNPNIGGFLHSPRDKPLTMPTKWSTKLEAVLDALYWRLSECCACTQTNVRVFRLYERYNVERIHNAHRYGYGQVSIDFLKTAVMSPEERSLASVNAEYETHCKRMAESGVDLPSCIQFLLDLYSQWTLNIGQPKPGVPLGLLLEIVRSTAVISDLFSERSHFAWLLDLCLELARTHPAEDEILHQYLVIASCKAAAVLPALETEACERVLRLLESGLKCSFEPTRTAAVYGLLYLLETFIHQQDDVIDTADNSTNKVPNTRQRLLAMAKEFIEQHFTAESKHVGSEESRLVVYSLVLYIMEHAPQELGSEVLSHLLQLVIASSNNRQIVIYQALMQGLGRLVLAEVEGVLTPVMRLAMDRLGQSDPAVSITALQQLLVCLYSGEYSKMRGEEGTIDPEQLVATIEKTSALFERVKKGSPLEVECVCAVLPFLLADFFPASEVLTKVIGEFLSPHQPNQQQLSAVVFQVISQACREEQLALLQAWLVMSLHIFTQTLPPVTATWCLSSFFISASTNPWLRSMFPHVQSRMGKCTYEDRKLLCIAALDFYRQLTDEKQKETFLKTFKDAANSPRSPFTDVLACLQPLAR